MGESQTDAEPKRRLMLPSDAWFDLAEECSCNAEHFAATHPIEDADPLVRGRGRGTAARAGLTLVEVAMGCDGL